MNKTYFVSVDNNPELYKKCVTENIFIKDNPQIICVQYNNREKNIAVSTRYNEFINEYQYDEDSWIVFCHNDWQIKEDIIPKLLTLDKHCVYGPIGASLCQNSKGTYIIEYYGACFERKRDGTNERYLKCILNRTGLQVDTLDCQCLIVHSSLIGKYKLRFDDHLNFDLYVEDFCLNARVNFNIPTKILSLECCHWSQVDSMEGRENFFILHEYIEKKYAGHIFAGCIKLIGEIGKNKLKVIHPKQIYTKNNLYHTEIDPDAENSSHAMLVRYTEPDSTVLDVGCATGSLGVALKKYKNCTCFGIELDELGIEIAQQTGAYEKIQQINLNNFSSKNHTQYIEKFDTIVFGDILEHLYHPQRVLEEFKAFLKPNGRMLLSIPNAGHASIKLNLLDNDWTYTDTGLLDYTHIRFFTYKTLAKLLADCELEIVENNYTVSERRGTQPTKPWRKLPYCLSAFVYSDPHSYVFQYIVKVQKVTTIKSYTKILEDNLALLTITPRFSNKFLCKTTLCTFVWYIYRKLSSYFRN